MYHVSVNRTCFHPITSSQLACEQILSSPWRIVQAEHSQSSVCRIVRDRIWLKGWHRMAPIWCLSHTKYDSRAVWTRFYLCWCFSRKRLVCKRERWTDCGPEDVTERAKRSISKANQTADILASCLFLPLHAGRGGIASDVASRSANDEPGRRAKTYVL